MSKLLTSDSPLILLPSLALEFGITEALLLQQTHYLLGRASTLHAGKTWTYQTAEQWHAMLPFVSIGSIRRAIAKLHKLGVILIEKLARWKSNRTNYYSIDYAKLTEIVQIGSQNGVLFSIKLAHDSTDASTQTDQNDLLNMNAPMCADCPHGYTKTTNKRTPQRVKARPILKNQTPRKIESKPIAAKPTRSGTVEPIHPTATPEQLESIPIDQRHLWQQLRQAKLDIAIEDPRLQFWRDNSFIESIIQTLLDQLDGGWHSPEQLGLPSLSTVAQTPQHRQRLVA